MTSFEGYHIGVHHQPGQGGRGGILLSLVLLAVLVLIAVMGRFGP